MVFRYEGNSDFYVLIFDESATEINYRSDGEEGKLDEEFEAPNMDEISVEILDDFLSSPCPKTRDKSPLPCLRPHKIMKTNSSGKIASTSQTCRQFKETKLEKLKTKANANATMREFKGVEICTLFLSCYLPFFGGLKCLVYTVLIIMFILIFQQKKVLKALMLPSNARKLKFLEGSSH